MSSVSSAPSAHVPAHDEPLDPLVWRVAIAIIIGAFMSIIDMTIVNVALRELGQDLGGAGLDQVQWVMTAIRSAPDQGARAAKRRLSDRASLAKVPRSCRCSSRVHHSSSVARRSASGERQLAWPSFRLICLVRLDRLW